MVALLRVPVAIPLLNLPLSTDVAKDPFRHLSALVTSRLICETEVNTLQDSSLDHIRGHVGEFFIFSRFLGRSRIHTCDRNWHVIRSKEQRECAT